MRQGCPISPILFSPSIDPLIIKPREENKFKGMYSPCEQNGGTE